LHQLGQALYEQNAAKSFGQYTEMPFTVNT
jgi:hypothetical protein